MLVGRYTFFQRVKIDRIPSMEGRMEGRGGEAGWGRGWWEMSACGFEAPAEAFYFCVLTNMLPIKTI